MLQTTTSPEALDALIASLGALSVPPAPQAEVLEFLDDCLARFVKVPIKYFDDLDAMRGRNTQSTGDVGPFSPILMTIVEQWPFKGGQATTTSSAESLAQWISRLLYLLKLIGEDETVLSLVRDALVESANQSYKDVLKDSFLWKMGKERAKEALKLATGADFSGSERSTVSPMPSNESDQPTKPKYDVDLEVPPKEDEKHIGLMRWKRKELGEAIEDGDIAQLLLCLCSEHAEIRLQAINNIHQLMRTLDTSGQTATGAAKGIGTQTSNIAFDMQQIYLLFGEILESVDQTGAEAFPYVGGVLAARCVGILADPTNSLFSTISKFLTKAPVWDTNTILRHFWHCIVSSEPNDDGTYHKEVEWYLDYLKDALRTPADMELFRRSNIFEQLLAHYQSRSCTVAAKEKIVKLLLRATHVGGSTTLITRCGLVSWIKMMLDNHDAQNRVLRALTSRVYETCDREKVAQWSSGTVSETVALLAKKGA